MTAYLTRKIEAFSTIFEVTLPEDKSDIVSLCFQELSRIERKYSRFLPASYLSWINSCIGKEIEVDEETYMLLSIGEYFNRATNGYFDIFVKELLDAYGYDSQYSFVQDNKKIEKFEIRRPKLDPERHIVKLFNQVDLGGIGKGYALDTLAAILKSRGVENFLLNGGGDFLAAGTKASAMWEILLSHPDSRDHAIGLIGLKNGSLCSSGTNIRKWNNVNHILNPITKKPASEFKQSFVLTQNATSGQVFSKAILLGDVEYAVDLAEKFGFSFMLISRSNDVYISKGFEAKVYHD